MNETQVKAEMKKFTGKYYDPTVLEILLNTDDIVSDELIEKQILTDAFEPGMVLKYDLFNIVHILVLPEGHVFCKATITKMVQFNKSQPKPMMMMIIKEQ
jgi:hypothetical protein